MAGFVEIGVSAGHFRAAAVFREPQQVEEGAGALVLPGVDRKLDREVKSVAARGHSLRRDGGFTATRDICAFHMLLRDAS